MYDYDDKPSTADLAAVQRELDGARWIDELPELEIPCPERRRPSPSPRFVAAVRAENARLADA